MSGLAGMLLDAGAIVSGSEPTPGPQCFDLVRRGAKISRDQIGEQLNREVDLVVRSAAVADSNQEMVAAHALKLPTIKYAQMLGKVMQERFGVAVAGTHGKSTTTAMISFALTHCGSEPSFVIGGSVPQLGGGSKSGSGPIFVAEACEFDRSFHNLRPRIVVITNIEADHLDCYASIDEIVESFRTFAAGVPEDGLIIAGADPNIDAALEGVKTRTERVALGKDFFWSTRILGVDKGCYRGEVSCQGKPLGTLRLSVAGEHNLLNATMALAACVACGVEPSAAMDALGRFEGVSRRMTVVGHYHGATVVDDYGHHPTEIRATLKALREQFKPRRLICVFQPHQHSRTRRLLDDFAGSFALADETIMPDIYSVRDSDAERRRISTADLIARVRANGQQAIHLSPFSRIVEHLKSIADENDLIVTMGAGNVWEIGRDLTAV